MSIRITRSSETTFRIRPVSILRIRSAVLMIGTGQYSPTVSSTSSGLVSPMERHSSTRSGGAARAQETAGPLDDPVVLDHARARGDRLEPRQVPLEIGPQLDQEIPSLRDE